MSETSGLRRHISLTMLVFYGLGNILGAGIYVLIGKIAGVAGMLTPLAFVVAAATAALTALSYCELSSRFPHSAGEAVYVENGFQRRWLSIVAGFVIAMAAIHSAATISHGFAGYLSIFIAIPEALTITLLIATLTVISCFGVKFAVGAAAALTLLEILGLLIILFTGTDALAEADFSQFVSVEGFQTSAIAISAVLSAAFLAFYAYLGFEDMVNMAEEVKDVRRNMPRAIIISLIVATVFYILIAMVVLASFPPQELSEMKAPLASVYEKNTGSAPIFISLISLFAVSNGALIQIIMVSRLLYGMSKQGWIWQGFSRLNTVTRTPVLATVVVGAAVLLSALLLPLESLAKSTSFFILVLFALINFALLKIKRRAPENPGGITIPTAVPWIAAVVAMSLIVFELASQ